MAIYIVTGKLGSGKTLSAVGKAFDYLRKGKRVATNIDLYPEAVLRKTKRNVDVTRIPDKPRVQDFEALGTADGKSVDEYNEEDFGLLLLDELGSWLNTRAWNDPERRELIEWFIHARKYHWDVILIVQDVSMIDKQVRDALCEHLVLCRRLDRLMVPIVGRLVKLLTGYRLNLPKMHQARVFLGENEQSGIKVDTWWYRGREYYKAYRTGQVFKHDNLLFNGVDVDMRASYSVLSPWHLVGRYATATSLSEQLKRAGRWLVLQPVGVIVRVAAWASGRSPVAQARHWSML